MIRLKTIEIENFKSLVKTSLELNANLTALIGANGAGKTNLLSAILLLKEIIGGVRRHRYVSPTESMAHSTLVATFLDGHETYRLKVVYYFNTLEGDQEVQTYELFMSHQNKKWISLDSDIFEYTDFIRKTREIKRDMISERFLPKGEDLRQFVIDLTSYISAISYYGATQFSDPSKSPISFEIEEGRLSRRSIRTRGHEDFLFDLYTTRKTQPTSFKKYLNTVNRLGIGLVDNIDFKEIQVPSSSIKVIAGGKTRKINRDKTFVIPVFTIDDLQLSPTQLSEGTFKSLALIFYILNSESDLLLIEEPEVCVHHGLLSSIVELIIRQSKKKQIIISTHSDYVLDSLKPENVIIVKKGRRGTTAEPLSNSISIDDFEALKLYLEEEGSLGEYWKEGGFISE